MTSTANLCQILGRLRNVSFNNEIALEDHSYITTKDRSRNEKFRKLSLNAEGISLEWLETRTKESDMCASFSRFSPRLEGSGSPARAQASSRVDVPTASHLFCSTDQGVQHVFNGLTPPEPRLELRALDPPNRFFITIGAYTSHRALNVRHWRWSSTVTKAFLRADRSDQRHRWTEEVFRLFSCRQDLATQEVAPQPVPLVPPLVELPQPFAERVALQLVVLPSVSDGPPEPPIALPWMKRRLRYQESMNGHMLISWAVSNAVSQDRTHNLVHKICSHHNRGNTTPAVSGENTRVNTTEEGRRVTKA